MQSCDNPTAAPLSLLLPSLTHQASSSRAPYPSQACPRPSEGAPCQRAAPSPSRPRASSSSSSRPARQPRLLPAPKPSLAAKTRAPRGGGGGGKRRRRRRGGGEQPLRPSPSTTPQRKRREPSAVSVSVSVSSPPCTGPTAAAAAAAAPGGSKGAPGTAAGLGLPWGSSSAACPSFCTILPPAASTPALRAGPGRAPLSPPPPRRPPLPVYGALRLRGEPAPSAPLHEEAPPPARSVPPRPNGPRRAAGPVRPERRRETEGGRAARRELPHGLRGGSALRMRGEVRGAHCACSEGRRGEGGGGGSSRRTREGE